MPRKKKLRGFKINGLPRLMDEGAINLQINEWRPRQNFQHFMCDLSPLSSEDQSGHLLLLSDESRLLAEYNTEGELVGLMPLWRGWHGLATSIQRAGGVAVGRDGTIYIISEPNLFYRFERKNAAR